MLTCVLLLKHAFDGRRVADLRACGGCHACGCTEAGLQSLSMQPAHSQPHSQPAFMPESQPCRGVRTGVLLICRCLLARCASLLVKGALLAAA